MVHRINPKWRCVAALWVDVFVDPALIIIAVIPINSNLSSILFYDQIPANLILITWIGIVIHAFRLLLALWAC